ASTQAKPMLTTTIRTVLFAALASMLLGCSTTATNRTPAIAAGATPGCLMPGAWHRLDQGQPVPVSGADVLDRAAQQDVVLLGEYHTSADDHRWQLQTLAAL